ncbi:hypothetical protein CORC01_04078 [Colletotrichum orchidophilum]|uniref:Uncharacterized protein n=1 Tax=Colletotrichum orchidophilum TaxID=1209926 RepID=A0A1G4BH80_9PEZI|nr:uncharacterized protein CORC01_04078 [Colletotrichum orchidophilum]OHF00761.1 hypothetical protein CORC01_04078 [Colletotrichum orchidophilum]
MAHSGQSAYIGHSSSKASHKYSSKESRKETTQRRTSMYQNQPASDEPSAYGATFRSGDIAASKACHQARAADNISKIMGQFGGN